MATYYVDGISGNDGAAGSSAAPWKTLNKPLNTGGVVAGDVIRVRTATYYETIEVNKGIRFEADTGHTPTIDGRYSPALFGAAGYKDGCGSNLNANTLPALTAANAALGNWVYPGSSIKADGTGIAVKLNAVNARIKGFIIRNIPGRAIGFIANNTMAEDCIVDFCYGGAIVFDSACDGGVLRGTTVTRSSVKQYDPCAPGAGPSAVATTVIIKGRNCIAENNIVCYNCGEGISADKGSVGVIIRYNTVHTNNHWGYGFNYASGAQIYGNIGYWCDNLAGAMGKDGPGDLFTCGSERADPENPKEAYSPDIQIYNNLLVGGKRALLLGGEGRPVQFVRGYVGYNTLVGYEVAGKAKPVLVWATLSTAQHQDTLVENNVIIALGSRQLVSYQSGGSVTWRNNLANATVPGGMNGAGTIVTTKTAATLVNPGATVSGTFNVKSTSLPSVVTTFNPANYDLTSTSQAVGRASNRSKPYGWTLPSVAIDRRKDGRTDYNAAQGRYYDIGSDEYDGIVTPPDPTVTAAFAMNPAATTILVNSTVAFTNQSVAENCNITGYTWTVKRGSTTMHTSTAANLTYAFDQVATWTVTLAVNTDGGVSDTQAVTIVVEESGGDPSVTASFSRSPATTTINQGTTIQFTNTSTVVNTTKTGQTWEVRTSPGNTLVTSATTNDFSHTFSTAGTFIVKLTVNTAAGVSDTEQVTITVNVVTAASVTSDFTASAGPTVDEGTSITFTNTSTVDGTTITGHLWTVTNGAVSVTYTTANMTHVFSQAGTWTVSLLETTAAGVTDDESMTITVRTVSSYGTGLYKSMIVPYRTAVSTATGEQTITTSALGTLVPKGATVRLVGAVADATAADGSLWSEGATDGTAQWTTSRFSQDNVAGGTAKRRYKSGSLLQTIDSTGAITGEAVFARFVAGGMVINITDAFPAAYLVEIDFYAGDDMRVACGTTTLGGVDVEVPVTSGIDQDFVYLVGSFCADGAASASPDADLSRGWALKNGNMAALRNQDKDAANPSSPNTRYSTVAAGVSGDGTPGVLVYVKADQFTPTGFKMRPTVNSLNSLPVGWFAVALGGPRVSLTAELLNTTNPSTHVIPFEAQTVLAILSSVAITGITTTESFNNTSAEGIGYYATSIYSSGAEYTMWVVSADNVNPGNTKSWSDDSFRAIGPDGSNKWNGTGTIGSTAIEFGWSAAPASKQLVILLAVEESEPLPEAPPGDEPPTVDFTADVRSGYTKLLVQFDSSLTNDNGSAITGYLWDFGDGGTSTEANPKHVYRQEGEFTVVLTVTNANGASTKTVEAFVTTMYPQRRRTLVGPIRSRPITSDSTDRVDLDWPSDDDYTDDFGFAAHEMQSMATLRILPRTSSEIAAMAAGIDGLHVVIVWNTDTAALNVIGTDGTIHEL